MMSKRERKRLIVVQGGVQRNNLETDCTGSDDSILSIFGSRSFHFWFPFVQNECQKRRKYS